MFGVRTANLAIPILISALFICCSGIAIGGPGAESHTNAVTNASACIAKTTNRGARL